MSLFTPKGICALRISRAEADGTPDFGNTEGAIVLCGGIISMQTSPQTQDGAEFNESDGCGQSYVSFKDPDYTTRVDFTLEIGRFDWPVQEIMGVGDALLESDDVVGVALELAAGCDTGTAKTPVIIEFWTQRLDCSALGVPAYVHHVLPNAYATPQDQTHEAAPGTVTFAGFSTGNSNFGDGPFHDFDFGLTGSHGYAAAETNSIPTCSDPFDYIALTA